MMLKNIFADLHIHIGSDAQQNPIKISASKHLTLRNILQTANKEKGIELIGIVDGHVPNILKEIHSLITTEDAYELADGGIRFQNVTLLLGSEIEVYDEYSKGPYHVLIFLPTLETMFYFSLWLKDKMKNIHLSSQRIYCTGRELQRQVKQLEGIFIPAHVFTPFKSLYGKGVNQSLTEVLNPDDIDAIELGLSSDTKMADQIRELHRYEYVTNSDSHSLNKIGREYQQIKVKEASFQELAFCLAKKNNRKIVSNYGMNPRLGKYYRTVCQTCFIELTIDTTICPHCKSKKVVKGVYDRIQQIKSNDSSSPERPPYIYQVPLEYIPGLGKKTLRRLLEVFGTEMNVIHHVTFSELCQVVPEIIARNILKMREGSLEIEAGGGGKYGRVKE